MICHSHLHISEFTTPHFNLICASFSYFNNVKLVWGMFVLCSNLRGREGLKSVSSDSFVTSQFALVFRSFYLVASEETESS